MTTTVDPAKRTAAAPVTPHEGPVTLINSFVVPSGREEAFAAVWTETSAYFRAQAGFVSLRMHRALSPDAQYRFVNVARWASAGEFRDAHAGDEFPPSHEPAGVGRVPEQPQPLRGLRRLHRLTVIAIAGRARPCGADR